MNSKNIQKWVQKTIEEWVGRNFGSQELDDPSWNIKALSRCIAKEFMAHKGELIENPDLLPYELTVLFNPDDLNLEGDIERVNKIITDFGGVVDNIENAGTKHVPYPIRGHERANYVYFDIRLKAPAQVSSMLNVEDCVLRYLMVKKDTRN